MRLLKLGFSPCEEIKMWLHAMPFQLDHFVTIIARQLSFEDVSTLHIPSEQTQLSTWQMHMGKIPN